MFNYKKKIKLNDDKLYNKILLLSRNNLLYTKLGLKDTFQNRIHLIFLHISFLFIKIKLFNHDDVYRKFNQQMFDLIFKKIEFDMREKGNSDATVNKNMKFLVKSFYDILINCENYNKKNLTQKRSFLFNYINIIDNNVDNTKLINYFNKYCLFCLDLSLDKVLKGELNFSYN